MTDELVLLERDSDDSVERWTVSMPAHPGVLSQGTTIPEALRNMAEAVELWQSCCSRLPDDTEYRSATTTVTHTIDSES